MRHIRDPITGYCIICEKNNIRHLVGPNELDDSASIHGYESYRSTNGGRGSRPGKKIIYVSTYQNGSPTPSRRPSSPASFSSSSSDNYAVDSPRKSRISTRSTSRVNLVDRSGHSVPPRQAGASRYPSPSPAGNQPRRSFFRWRKGSPDTEPGCCRRRRGSPDAESRCCGRTCLKKNGTGRAENGRFSKSRVFDESAAYEDGTDRCCGYRNFETASFGAGTWGIRRWCVPLIVLLALLALAGLATGIYFGVKSAQDKSKVKESVATFIKSQVASYIIVGADQPCMKVNNNPKTWTTLQPLCAAITTKIVAATKNFVAPTDPDWAVALYSVSAGSDLQVAGFVIFVVVYRAIVANWKMIF